MTSANVSLFKTFLKVNCARESTNPPPADAETVHVNPIACFAFETTAVSAESVWRTRRVEDMVKGREKYYTFIRNIEIDSLHACVFNLKFWRFCRIIVGISSLTRHFSKVLKPVAVIQWKSLVSKKGCDIIIIIIIINI